MKNKHRIWRVLLILSLLLHLHPLVLAAGEDSISLSLRTDQPVVTEGEQVSVTLCADRDFDARGAGFTLCYDAAVLEPDLEASSAVAPFEIHGPLEANGKTVLRISFLPGAETVQISAREALAVLSFKTLVAAEKTDLSLEYAWIYDETLTEQFTALPEPLGLQVKSTIVPEPVTGYTVQMPEDLQAVIGKTVLIPVVVSSEDRQSVYNAFDITFAYDPQVLELVSTTLPGLSVFPEPGQVTVLGYGRDREADTIPFVLEFRTLKPETTQIRILEARVDNSDHAVKHNASPADLVDDCTVISVTGYPVTLPEGFEGGATAFPGRAYIFWEPDDYYEYTVKATVSGDRVPVTDQEDGSYTISGAYITGPVVVTATRQGKEYRVKLGTGMSGNATARYGEDYVATLQKEENYRYAVGITIGGKTYTGYTVSGDTYTIPGGDITGNIIFTVTKTAVAKPPAPVTTHTVTFTGSGAGAAEGNPTTVNNGATYILTLKKEAGYEYQVSCRMGQKTPVVLQPGADGRYTIPNVTAPLEILIEKTLVVQVSVHSYLNLDEKTVFLILADVELEHGKLLHYEGEAMYYSEAYEAWCFLVILDYDLVESDTAGRFTVTQCPGSNLKDWAGDVDCSGTVDMDDINLVTKLYNAEYSDFSEINMVKFLNGDVNRDRKLDILDAAAVAHIFSEG